MVKPLLFRPKLITGESLSNYLLRLCEANRYFHISYISDLLDMKLHQVHSNSFSNSALETLSLLTLKDKENFYSRTTNYYEEVLGKRLGSQLILKTNVKCCPDCVNKDVYHKIEWTLRFVGICPYHRVILVDNCSCCSKKLTFASLINGICNNCGLAINKMKKEVILEKDALYPAQFYFQRLLKQETELLWSKMEQYSKSFYLLDGLNSFVESSINDRTSVIQSFVTQKHGGVTNKKLSLAFANAYWMFNNFPFNFYKVLDEFYQKSYQVRKYQKNQFEKLFDNGEFKVIEEAYDEYWKLQVKLRNAHYNFTVLYSSDINGSYSNYTKKDLMNQYSLTRNEVNQIWNNKEFLTEVKRGGEYKEVFLGQYINDVLKYLENKKNCITKKEVAVRLGLSIKIVTRLVKGGYLTQITVIGSGNNFFEKVEVENFREKYRKIFIDNNPMGLLYGNEKGKKIEYSLITLLEMIDEGLLVSDTAFNKDQIISILKHQRKQKSTLISKHFRSGERMYSLEELTKLFKMKSSTIHKLIAKKIITIDKIVKTPKGNQRYYFSKNEVDGFLSNYIKVPAAAEEFNITKKKLLQFIKNGQLVNVLHGMSRINLLKRKDIIEKFRVHNKK
ncbi:TniQ family protein [Peribacillus butanolivorans]|uniref:TniQ family protein n=1 Tax=Peribacillus butanolivorans TaxID=421767 RepID=UPI0036760E1A